MRISRRRALAGLLVLAVFASVFMPLFFAHHVHYSCPSECSLCKLAQRDELLFCIALIALSALCLSVEMRMRLCALSQRALPFLSLVRLHVQLND